MGSSSVRIFIVVALVWITDMAGAQGPVSPTLSGSVVTAHSTLVLVPALVKNKAGEPVFMLTADQFVLMDDGIEQKVRVEEDTDSQPLALVIVVQTGGAGTRQLDNYRGLGLAIEGMVGGVKHRVAVVGFDSQAHVLQRFTSNLDLVGDAMHGLSPGDGGAAVIDGLGFAVDLLRKQPPQYRRMILLLSETVDHESQMKLGDALRVLSDTNTSIYSVAFSSSKDYIKHEMAKTYLDKEPGPPGGCMAKDPDKAPDPTDSRMKQTLQCLGLLVPPFRLAKAAAIAGVDGMRKNVPETVAQLTGGEYSSFKNSHDIERYLLALGNHIPNRYVLSFQPQAPHAGLHAIELRLKDNPPFVISFRTSYWADEDTITRSTP